MMSTDVKASIKEQEINNLAAYLTNKYLQNLKYNINGCIFHLILIDILVVLMVRGGGGALCLTDKIC